MVKDGSRFCHKCGAEMPAAEEKSAPTGLAALADYSMGAIRTDDQRKTETAYVPDKTDKADKPREADLGGKKRTTASSAATGNLSQSWATTICKALQQARG